MRGRRSCREGVRCDDYDTDDGDDGNGGAKQMKLSWSAGRRKLLGPSAGPSHGNSLPLGWMRGQYTGTALGFVATSPQDSVGFLKMAWYARYERGRNHMGSTSS